MHAASLPHCQLPGLLQVVWSSQCSPKNMEFGAPSKVLRDIHLQNDIGMRSQCRP